MKKIIVIGALLALTFGLAQEQRPQQGEERIPPQEAIAICDGQDEGTSCSMTTPRGDTMEGTCGNTPDGKYFACKPKNPPRRK